MRTVQVDLSSDSIHVTKLFGGYQGEHNATLLRIKLPNRMLNANRDPSDQIDQYRFDFDTSTGENVYGDAIEPSAIVSGYIQYYLPQGVMFAPTLSVCVCAFRYNSVDPPEAVLVEKSSAVDLLIKNYVAGSEEPSTVVDPFAPGPGSEFPVSDGLAQASVRNELSTAGCLGFYFKDTSVVGQTFTATLLDKDGNNADLSALSEGDEISSRAGFSWNFSGEIDTISGSVVTITLVSPIPSTWDPTTRQYDNWEQTPGNQIGYLWIPEKPDAGSVKIGTGAMSVGWDNKANEMGSFAAGVDNIVDGRYAFASGSGNKVGFCGHAEGIDNVVKELYSHAEGGYNEASGNCSHAEGRENKATGARAHAEGYQTTASGAGSHAEGVSQTLHGNTLFVAATGLGSHAEGIASVASGEGAHAEGRAVTLTEGDVFTAATGAGSHAEGTGTTASGQSSHSEGTYNTASGDDAHAEGSRNTASGNHSHAEGRNNTAGGTCAHVEGVSNTIHKSANNSHAEGGSNTLDTGSVYSHAEGNQNTINYAKYAHAEGRSNTITANADGAHAEGTSNEVRGVASHAEGSGNTIGNGTSLLFNMVHVEGYSNTVGVDSTDSPDCVAAHVEGANNNVKTGRRSHVEGEGNIVAANHQHVQGKYNTELGSDYVDIVGWGSSGSDRKNISVLDKDGNLYLAGDVFVGNTSADATSGGMIIPRWKSLRLGDLSWTYKSTEKWFCSDMESDSRYSELLAVLPRASLCRSLKYGTFASATNLTYTIGWYLVKGLHVRDTANTSVSDFLAAHGDDIIFYLAT